MSTEPEKPASILTSPGFLATLFALIIGVVFIGALVMGAGHHEGGEHAAPGHAPAEGHAPGAAPEAPAEAPAH